MIVKARQRLPARQRHRNSLKPSKQRRQRRLAFKHNRPPAPRHHRHIPTKLNRIPVPALRVQQDRPPPPILPPPLWLRKPPPQRPPPPPRSPLKLLPSPLQLPAPQKDQRQRPVKNRRLRLNGRRPLKVPQRIPEPPLRFRNHAHRIRDRRLPRRRHVQRLQQPLRLPIP